MCSQIERKKHPIFQILCRLKTKFRQLHFTNIECFSFHRKAVQTIYLAWSTTNAQFVPAFIWENAIISLWFHSSDCTPFSNVAVILLFIVKMWWWCRKRRCKTNCYWHSFKLTDAEKSVVKIKASTILSSALAFEKNSKQREKKLLDSFFF